MRRGLKLLVGSMLVVFVGCAVYDPSKITFQKAYSNAAIFGEKNNKAILLHLHGCDGLFIYSGYQYDWIEFFVNKGFKIIAPDSFADYRPPQSCSSPWLYKNSIYDIRRRQTTFAIKNLKTKYPDLPIIVWGHSEGGGVANRIDEKVDAIITTGYQCGFRSTGVTHIRPDVRLLVILGTDDQYIKESVGYSPYISMNSLCDGVLRSSKWERMVIKDMGHRPYLNREIKERLSAFVAKVLE